MTGGPRCHSAQDRTGQERARQVPYAGPRSRRVLGNHDDDDEDDGKGAGPARESRFLAGLSAAQPRGL